MGAVGFIDKDAFPEGPFKCRFFQIILDDPSILSNVKLWMGPRGGPAYYLADGIETTEGGDTFFVFEGDTRRARKQLSDGSLEGGSSNPVFTSLKPGSKYLCEVSYSSALLDTSRAVGGRAEVTILDSNVIL